MHGKQLLRNLFGHDAVFICSPLFGPVLSLFGIDLRIGSRDLCWGAVWLTPRPQGNHSRVDGRPVRRGSIGHILVFQSYRPVESGRDAAEAGMAVLFDVPASPRKSRMVRAEGQYPLLPLSLLE